MIKPIAKTPLSFEEIVIRADLSTIQAALEARQKIDDLLQQREEAYKRIADLENQVDSILGQPGVFVFPAPPVVVASVPKPQNQAKKTSKSEDIKSGKNSENSK